jgi:hypothetical protein
MIIDDSSRKAFMFSQKEENIHKVLLLVLEICEYVLKDKKLFQSEWIIMNFLFNKCLISWATLIKELLLQNYLEKFSKSSELSFEVKIKIKISMSSNNEI